jgi:hypothetical protein
MMNEQQATWENRIQDIASTFTYPPTPEMTMAVREKLRARRDRKPQRQTRLAWVIVLALLLAAGLLAVPQVRAAVLRFFQIGAITIFETGNAVEATAEVSDTPIVESPITATSTLFSAGVPETIIPATATPLPLYVPLTLTDFATLTTLAEAQAFAPFTLRLPAYPADLGMPDAVYIQESSQAQTVIFTWQEPANAEVVRLALYEIWGDNFALKQAEQLQQTSVNGRDAVWVEGPHLFRLQDGRVESWQFVPGNVLIWWTADGVTYRLEGAESLAEAIRMAESLEE